LACLDYEDPLFKLPQHTWEILLDDAGDPGGPTLTQGVVLLGEGFQKTLRGFDGARREIPWDRGRADTGFRVVLDP
jgi:hypothetical protein